jgi:hypothetical protein
MISPSISARKDSILAASAPLAVDCNVTGEIITTERSYIHEVRTYLEVFIRPLQRHASRSDGCITPKEVSVLECNMEEIFTFSRQLLRELEKQKDVDSLGQIFADLAEQMRIAYTKFISIYLDAIALNIHLLKEKRKRKGSIQTFSAYMKETSDRQRQRVKNRQIPDFLILPIQRVPRYRLLLIELWKKTKPSYERDWLKEAVLRVSAVATEMNRSLSHATSQRKIEVELSRRQVNSSEQKAELDEEKDSAEAELFEKLESITEQLYRPRNPTLFNIDQPYSREKSGNPAGDDDDQNFLLDGLTTKEDELERLCLVKGWQLPDGLSISKHAPTTNPLVLYHVLTRDNPWKVQDNSDKKTEKNKTNKPLSALQISMRLLRGIYAPTLPPKPFHPKSNDIIVAGAVRSGQTPILHILECLRTGNVVPLTTLVDRVCWLESDDWDSRSNLGGPAGLFPHQPNGRLIKTHARLNQAFGGVLIPAQRGTRPEFKVVVVLRDPADIRLSFFRHARRLFRKVNAESPLDFDQLAKVDDFISSIPFYEAFVNDCLKVAYDIESPQLMVVFYEELLGGEARVRKVVEKLAEFTDVLDEFPEQERQELINDITLEIVQQAEYPRVTNNPPHVSGNISENVFRRAGSSFQGRQTFSKYALAKIDETWNTNISLAYKKFYSYDALFTYISKVPLFVGVDKEDRGIFATSQTNGTTSSTLRSSLVELKKKVITGSGVLAGRISRSGSFILMNSSLGATKSPKEGGENSVKPEFVTGQGPKNRPRPGTFIIMAPTNPLLRRTNTDQSTATAKSSQLGIGERPLFRVRRNSLAKYHSNDNHPSDVSVETTASKLKQVIDPDDSDDDAETVSASSANTPKQHFTNVVGERM